MKAKVVLVACESYDRDEVSYAIQVAIDSLGGIEGFIKPNQKVLIKPNLCLAEPPEKCITTHPEIIRKVASICSEYGANVVIGDNPVGDADSSRIDLIWERSGITTALEGITYERSLLNDNIKAHKSYLGNKSYDFYISEDISAMDLIINIPKFKTHSLLTFTGAVKNLFGLLPGNSKKRLHSELPAQKNFASLLVDIYNLIRPGLHIMDAVIGMQGDGPGAAGEMRKIGLIMASRDGIALDSVAMRLMNMEPKTLLTNAIAEEKGFGKIDVEIVGESIDPYIMKDFKIPSTSKYHPDITKKIFDLSRAYINIDSVKCKSCYLCYNNCPASCISMNKGFASIDKKRCISCMTCHEICPNGAVYIYRSTFYQQISLLKKQSS